VSFARGQLTTSELYMKSQDIFILLKLISMEKSSPNQVSEIAQGNFSVSVRHLDELTGVGKTEVNASVSGVWMWGWRSARERVKNLSSTRNRYWNSLSMASS